MATQRLHRTASVTIANLKPGQFFATEPNAVVFTALRIAFSIEKSLAKSPNTCTVTISNLSEDTRADLQQRPLQLILDAGYEGDNARLFSGDIRYASTTNASATVTTKIQVGDGAEAYAFGELVRGYGAGTDSKQVLKDLVGSMGLSLPTSLDQAQGFFQTFASGVSVSGPSAQAVDRICKQHGLEWSIQDGTLQVLKQDAAAGGEALVISQETGMIGSPEYGNPPADGKPPLLSVKHELLPQAKPGGLLQITSRSIKGLFRIEKLKHDGDTNGTSWETSMEVSPR